MNTSTALSVVLLQISESLNHHTGVASTWCKMIFGKKEKQKTIETIETTERNDIHVVVEPENLVRNVRDAWDKAKSPRQQESNF